MAFGKPEVTTFARASMFLAGNGDGQNGAKNLPDFSMEMAVSILSDGTRVSVAPEQGARFAVGDVPNIGHTHLFDQLVQGVRVAQGNEATEVLVHLKPDFLGRLSIRAIADEHGVHVQIRAENEVVRQVMQDNLADLQQWLAERDLSFSQLSILADTGWHTQREPEWPARHVPGAPAPKPEATIEVPGNPMPHVTRGIIDYFA
jgi:hypothetical protein